MELSDKIRRAAFTLAVGSVGFGLGAITFADYGILDVVKEMRKETALEREADREYLEEIKGRPIYRRSPYTIPEPEEVTYYYIVLPGGAF